MKMYVKGLQCSQGWDPSEDVLELSWFMVSLSLFSVIFKYSLCVHVSVSVSASISSLSPHSNKIPMPCKSRRGRVVVYEGNTGILPSLILLPPWLLDLTGLDLHSCLSFMGFSSTNKFLASVAQNKNDVFVSHSPLRRLCSARRVTSGIAWLKWVSWMSVTLLSSWPPRL